MDVTPGCVRVGWANRVLEQYGRQARCSIFSPRCANYSPYRDALGQKPNGLASRGTTLGGDQKGWAYWGIKPRTAQRPINKRAKKATHGIAATPAATRHSAHPQRGSSVGDI